MYRGNPDNIVGILHIKDIFRAITLEQNKKSITPFIRDILKVKNTEDLLDVFHEFRKGKPHFAIVYDGSHVVGYVTLDNLLKAIVGEIKDEFHLTKDDFVKLEDGSLILKGSTPVFTLETLFHIDLPVEANTISGLIFEKINAFPAKGDVIEFDEFTLVVNKVEGSKIVQVRAYKKSRVGKA